jgi:RNA polymerase sigma-70 factor, ECF subfamily
MMALVEAMEPDQLIVRALRAGDEPAFLRLVDAHHGAMVWLATTFVSSTAVAEEVVQDAWQTILDNIASFEEGPCSSLRTWMFAVVVNLAQTRGVAAGQTPSDSDSDSAQPPMDPSRFVPDGHLWAGHWADPPKRFDISKLDEAELRRVVDSALSSLPASGQRVVWLRDVEGWTSPEVCEILKMTETEQRKLLHHGRANVCAALECHLAQPRQNAFRSPPRLKPAPAQTTQPIGHHNAA